jgi:hypothetical protein
MKSKIYQLFEVGKILVAALPEQGLVLDLTKRTFYFTNDTANVVMETLALAGELGGGVSYQTLKEILTDHFIIEDKAKFEKDLTALLEDLEKKEVIKTTEVEVTFPTALKFFQKRREYEEFNLSIELIPRHIKEIIPLIFPVIIKIL